MKNFLVIVLCTLIAILPSAPMFGADTTTPLVDHWSALEECRVSTSAPFYYPSILHEHKLGENEVVRGLPVGCCVNMDLPDRSGKRGWVRIEAGRKFVYDKTDGKISRLAECNNSVYDFEPIPTLAGLKGDPGPKGDPGVQGPPGPRGTWDYRGELTPPPPPPVKVVVAKKSSHTGWWIAGGVLLAGGIIAALASGGHKSSGTGPGGNTGPAF